MRIPVAAVAFLLPLVLVRSGPETVPPPRPVDARFHPYHPDPGHAWNRLHRALFLRQAADGTRHVHTTDPHLYPGDTTGNLLLLEGDRHRDAVARLDEFLAAPLPEGVARRLVLQHDLWAAFDYAARYPDHWVWHEKHDRGAVALRSRLARAIGRLALTDREIAALPDNYALATKQYPAAHDPAHPERAFLPPDLFDSAGPWVRFHAATGKPMAEQHFTAVGGRSAHLVFFRLPGGRAATERYLKGLGKDSVTQFPAGTMVAMVRRALAVDAGARVRVTPLTELVQIRVYRKVPPLATLPLHFSAVPGEQDVYEFVLDRPGLFAGGPGLRPVELTEAAEPFARTYFDPFVEGKNSTMRQMQSCTACHPGPGVQSMASMERGLKAEGKEVFRTYALDVELGYTVSAKVARYDWGLLQGYLEAK